MSATECASALHEVLDELSERLEVRSWNREIGSHGPFTNHQRSFRSDCGNNRALVDVPFPFLLLDVIAKLVDMGVEFHSAVC
jgi:hypothetical protein